MRGYYGLQDQYYLYENSSNKVVQISNNGLL